MHTNTHADTFYIPVGVMWLSMIFVDMLGMEMHTNTCVRVFVGRRMGGGCY